MRKVAVKPDAGYVLKFPNQVRLLLTG